MSLFEMTFSSWKNFHCRWNKPLQLFVEVVKIPIANEKSGHQNMQPSIKQKMTLSEKHLSLREN